MHIFNIAYLTLLSTSFFSKSLQISSCETVPALSFAMRNVQFLSIADVISKEQPQSDIKQRGSEISHNWSNLGARVSRRSSNHGLYVHFERRTVRTLETTKFCCDPIYGKLTFIGGKYKMYMHGYNNTNQLYYTTEVCILIGQLSSPDGRADLHTVVRHFLLTIPKGQIV